MEYTAEDQIYEALIAILGDDQATAEVASCIVGHDSEVDLESLLIGIQRLIYPDDAGETLS